MAIEGQPFKDPALEERYQNLTHELRCPKCQNQSIAESDAPIAADFRREVRSLMAEGKTDDEIKGFLSARYGDFVLYRPPFSTRTVVLWIAPGLALVGALIAVVTIVRRRTQGSFDDPREDAREGDAS